MILVTGATGNVGRPLMQLLHEEGVQVAAVTRDPAAAALPRTVHVVGGDPSHPHTLSGKLPAIEAVLLAPRAIGGATASLLSLAAEHGAQRAVVLSAATVEYGGGHRRFADEFKAAEDAIKASGLAWTFLRCADFAANTLAWAPQIRAAGVVRGAYHVAGPPARHRSDGRAGLAQQRTRGTLLRAHRPPVTQPAGQGAHHRRGHRQEAVLPGDLRPACPPDYARAGPSRGRP